MAKRKGRFLAMRREQERRLTSGAKYFTKYRGANGRFEKFNSRKVQTPEVFQVTKRLTRDRKKEIIKQNKVGTLTGRRKKVTSEQLRAFVRRSVLKRKGPKDRLEITEEGEVIIMYPKRRRAK